MLRPLWLVFQRGRVRSQSAEEPGMKAGGNLLDLITSAALAAVAVYQLISLLNALIR